MYQSLAAVWDPLGQTWLAVVLSLAVVWSPLGQAWLAMVLSLGSLLLHRYSCL